MECKKTNDAQITLIITVYNGERFLPECLDSVVQQTYQQFKLILVDDGSKDGSGDIADEYVAKYPGLIKTVHQKNGGLSNARNTGLRYADTEYVGFADADDKLMPDYLEKLYEAIAANDSDYVICGYTRIDAEGSVLGVRNAKDWEMKLDDGKNHVFTYTAWGRLYKASLIKESGMQFSDGEGLEDIPFNIYMNIAARKCIAIEYAGYMYRVSRSSITEVIKHNGTAAAPKVMKFPYKGLENTIIKMREDYGSRYDDILCYEIIKNFTGLLFFVSQSSTKEDIRKVSEYEQEILHKYFDKNNLKNISYFKVGRLSKMPLSYRMAVKLYIQAYKMNSVYRYAIMYKNMSGIGRLKRT
jgi:glycosyltransferase involved in cell wall biosynthesis